MIRNVLESIGDAWAYQAFALIFFLLLFLGVCVVVFRMRKSHVDRMGALPLDDDNLSSGD